MNDEKSVSCFSFFTIRMLSSRLSRNVSYDTILPVLLLSKGSHSLVAFATYIIGQTPFPEFSAVVMLDDLQVMFCDSITRQAVHRSYDDSKHCDEEKSDAGVIFRDMYNDMKGRAFYLKEHLNHTDGVHVHQRLAGCELLNDDKPGPLQTWDAFDQKNKEAFIFNEEKNHFQIELPWIMWDNLQFAHMKFLYKNVYHPVCIKVLQSYLRMKKNNVMRTVKPRVRLMKKTLTDSQGLQISCLATGFYPRHINLTLFRDAPQSGQQTGHYICVLVFMCVVLIITSSSLHLILFKHSHTQFCVSVVFTITVIFVQDEDLRHHTVNTLLLHVSTLCLKAFTIKNVQVIGIQQHVQFDLRNL
uniref:Immunoglobulin C1-set domain-containing protein n=1 Tax=Sinocyclocheilus grahami TaxID=75366 RepID=A0A672MJT5_SINGR